MYRILLFLCISKTMAFDSDEAKYIDLLPEAEKQEFLNRIARRILEEIQSKDSPEQSHAEVTDDQLDAHETYVQEILKEESDNLRNEKREISQLAKDELEANDPIYEDKKSNPSFEDEKTHIDLTLRNGHLNTDRRLNENQNLNNNPDTNNDTPYSVIPVKVVYDKDIVNEDDSTTHTSLNSTNDGEQSVKKVPQTFDHQFNNTKNNENTSNSNENKPFSVEDIPRPDQSNKESPNEGDESTVLPNAEREVEEISSTSPKQEIVHKYDNNFEISEEKSTIDSNNDQESSTKVDMENEKRSDDVTNVPIAVISKDTKSAESLKTIESSTKNEIYDQSTLMPLTTELNILSDSKNVKISEKFKETTIKGLTINPNTKYHNKDNISGNVGNESSKKHYRKKLKIFSENYSIEEVESFESSDRQNDEDNAIDRYIVYEMSDDKPPFIQKAVTKVYDNPYYIPIYNYAPNNAYYNAYNHLGPNVNEEFELPDDNDEIDEKLFRSSFLIDLRSQDDKKARYKYPKEKIRPDPREYYFRYNPILEETRSNYNPYVDTDYYFYTKKARRRQDYNGEDYRWRQYKSGQQSLDSNIDLPDFTMDKNIEKLVYGSRRRGGKERKRHKKQKLSVRELPGSGEADHPYYSIHKSNIKDHIRAVRKLLYKQKKFGFMPSPYAIKTEPRYKRMMGKNEDSAVTDKKGLSRDNIMKQSDTNTKNIAWDYYWGRLKNVNITNDFDDFDEEEVSKLHGGRRGFNTENSNVPIDALTDVLKDMIRRDSRYLVSYNWLQTTVEVVGAIKKLLHLTEDVENGHRIHTLDLDLLNYVIDSYISSKDLLENNLQLKTKSQNSKLQSGNIDVKKTIKCLLARMRTLPKTKRRKPGEKIKNPITLWNTWNNYYNRVLHEDNADTNLLSDFKDFLIDLQDNLYELHNALKRIAFITTYKKQNWYQDLKSIFLKSAPRRRLQQVLLHLGTSKLIDSIENSMKKRNYGKSLKNNKKDSRRIQEYFVFVLEVLEVMNGKTKQLTNDFLRECGR